MTSVFTFTAAVLLALVQLRVANRVTSLVILRGWSPATGISALTLLRFPLALLAVLVIRDWGLEVGMLGLLGYHLGFIQTLYVSARRGAG